MGALDSRISRRSFLKAAGAIAATTAVGGGLLVVPDMIDESLRKPPSSVLLPPRNSALPLGPLHTKGAQILGADNGEVLLEGCNWYGFESEGMVIGGLHQRPLDEIAKTVGEVLGFNSVRMPFSVEAVLRNPRIYEGLDANPHLQGMHFIDLMDATINALANQGVRTILDCHRASAGWTGGGTPDNGLWYDSTFGNHDWLTCWQEVARHYRGNPAVIGFDLFNEPGRSSWWTPYAESFRNGAVWGGGNANPMEPRDWALAAEECGNTILKENPDALIFIEGVRFDPAGPSILGFPFPYWPGSNLSGARAAGDARKEPRLIHLNVPNRLVYSPHDYGPDIWPMPWVLPHLTDRSPYWCEQIWNQAWFFLAEEGRAPIWMGETGTNNGYQHKHPAYSYAYAGYGNSQGNWFEFSTKFRRKHKVSYSLWCLNGTKSKNPGTTSEDVESYGLLKPDWKTISNVYVLNSLRQVEGVEASQPTVG